MPTDRTNQINAEAGKVHLLSAKTIKEFSDAIKRQRPKAGQGLTTSEADDGITLNTDPNAQGGGNIPTPPPSGTWILGTINGTIQWIDTTACS